MHRELVVETQNLTKRYGPRAVVEGLDLRVYRGEVYGFLGANGAGKTTTLRMLLGLIRPTAGTAKVLGRRPGTEAGLTGVGALVETPTFYPHLSGWDNLRVLARYSGTRRERIVAVLEEVDLMDRARDRVTEYSLGMKQRLGVAAALLKDPELLLLDEPTNGLDPEGLVAMRGLVRQLGRGERSVVLSSHLLGEVEQVCSRVGMLRDGRLVAEGSVAELRGRERLRLRATPLARARQVAERHAGVTRVDADDGTLFLTADPAVAKALVRRLVLGDVNVEEVHPVERSLEQVLFDLAQGTPNAR